MKKINCILLVDDNPADNEFHTIVIKKAEVCNHIKAVTDGTQALDYLKKSGDPKQSESFPVPDIIYLDINMPGINGFEFLEEYGKLDLKVKPKAVIIMLSVSLNPDDKKRAMGFKEVSEFENKPLTTEMIRETVERFF